MKLLAAFVWMKGPALGTIRCSHGPFVSTCAKRGRGRKAQTKKDQNSSRIRLSHRRFNEMPSILHSNNLHSYSLFFLDLRSSTPNMAANHPPARLTLLPARARISSITGSTTKNNIHVNPSLEKLKPNQPHHTKPSHGPEDLLRFDLLASEEQQHQPQQRARLLSVRAILQQQIEFCAQAGAPTEAHSPPAP